MQYVDVAIVGGGPAGTAAAITLARSGATVTVLERSRYDQARVGEILAPAVKLPLTALGVWSRFSDDGHMASPGVVSSWGQARPYTNDFVVNPYGCGWHVDRARFDRMLASAAQEAGAAIHCGARFVDCRDAGDGWRLDAVGGGELRSVHADFVVDATGRVSRLARRLGAGRVVNDRLVGVVGVMDSPVADTITDRRMLLESCPDGWWYSAELPGNRCVAAYMSDADQIAGTHLKPIDLWRKRRPSAPLTDCRIGAIKGNVKVRVIAAGTSRLQRIAADNWAAVGDAAAAFDPLSGNGIVRAIESGLAMGRALTKVGGDRRAARDDIAAEAEHRFTDYLRLRTDYYRRETRWPNNAFWARRRIEDPATK